VDPAAGAGEIFVHGVEFDEGVYQQEGHIEVDLGWIRLSAGDLPLTTEAGTRVRANVQKLWSSPARWKRIPGPMRACYGPSQNRISRKS